MEVDEFERESLMWVAKYWMCIYAVRRWSTALIFSERDSVLEGKYIGRYVVNKSRFTRVDGQAEINISSPRETTRIRQQGHMSALYSPISCMYIRNQYERWVCPMSEREVLRIVWRFSRNT
jgi:hypothetical protein